MIYFADLELTSFYAPLGTSTPKRSRQAQTSETPDGDLSATFVDMDAVDVEQDENEGEDGSSVDAGDDLEEVRVD